MNQIPSRPKEAASAETQVPAMDRKRLATLSLAAIGVVFGVIALTALVRASSGKQLRQSEFSNVALAGGPFQIFIQERI